jgi:hypothetical protein
VQEHDAGRQGPQGHPKPANENEARDVDFGVRRVAFVDMSNVATKYPQVGNGIDFTEMDPEDRLKLSESILDWEQHQK